MLRALLIGQDRRDALAQLGPGQFRIRLLFVEQSLDLDDLVVGEIESVGHSGPDRAPCASASCPRAWPAVRRSARHVICLRVSRRCRSRWACSARHGLANLRLLRLGQIEILGHPLDGVSTPLSGIRTPAFVGSCIRPYEGANERCAEEQAGCGGHGRESGTNAHGDS